MHKHTTSTHSETKDSLEIVHVYLKDTVYIEKVVEVVKATETNEDRDIITETHEYNDKGALVKYIKTTDRSQIKTIDSLTTLLKEQEERLQYYQRSDTTANITEEVVTFEEEKKTFNASFFMVIILIIVAIIALYKFLR